VVAKKVCKKRATPDRLRDYTLFDHFRRMKIVTLLDLFEISNGQFASGFLPF